MRITPSILSRSRAAVMLLALAAAPAFALDVEVWTDKGDDAVYSSGDAMRIKVRPSSDAHLLVYEIDAQGAVNLLYPFQRGPAFVEGGQTLRLPLEDSGHQLIVGDETGQGFIVAVASDRPFRDLPWFLRPFDPQAASIGYDIPIQDSASAEEGFDERGHVVGDPYVAMERIRRRVVDAPEDVSGIASDYTTYYVHEVVRYPRYLCNDCHRPGHWAWWAGFDPYYASCSVFDFRVNWRWYWGPTLWTGYVPYYYYVVRTDCPPYYTPWYGGYRFTSWDGWNRWTDLWGGQLRRYKPGVAPVSYTPPPPRGMIWRKGDTPPGFVPADVRTRTGGAGGGMRDVIVRQREAKGGPAWRGKPGGGTASAPGVKPGGRSRPSGENAGDQGGARRGRGGQSPQGGDAPETKERGEQGKWWRPAGDSPPRGGRDKAKDPPRAQPKERPSNPPPSYPTPSRDEPRNPPPSDEPRERGKSDGGGGGGYRPPPSNPPPSNPPPSNPPPRYNPPTSRPSPPGGRGGKGGGGSG